MLPPGTSSQSGNASEEKNSGQPSLSPSLQRMVSSSQMPLSFTSKQRRIMASKNAYDTASLVNSYNTAKTWHEKGAVMDILNRYIHFIKNPPRELTEDDWKSYLVLGNIESSCLNDKEQTFWLSWVNSIVKNMDATDLVVIESLELGLQMVPYQVFVNYLYPLNNLANQLLKMLDPQEIALVAENFRFIRPKLLSLHQVFILMQLAAEGFLNRNQQLYRNLMNRLDSIKQEQRYYPIYVLACMVEQGVFRIEKDDEWSRMVGWCRKGLYGVRAIMHISNVISKVVKFEFDIDALDNAIEDFRKAIKSDAIYKEKWYDTANYISALANKSLHDNTAFDEFYDEIKTLLKEESINSFDKHNYKLLQFALIGQLQFFVCNCSKDTVCQKCLDLLLDISEQYELRRSECDVDIFEALLDALGYVYNRIDNKKKKQLKLHLKQLETQIYNNLRIDMLRGLGIVL